MEAQSETGLVRRADGTALKKTYLFGSPNIQNFVDMLTQVN